MENRKFISNQAKDLKKQLKKQMQMENKHDKGVQLD